jgi:polyisoprenoid-binding protein YceI
MKNVMLLLIWVCANGFTSTSTFLNVDLAKSKIHWLGKKTTGQHEGNVTLKSGKIVLKGNEPVSAEFEIDMSSITVTDITNADDNKSLVNHLKDKDFFNVAEYGTATLSVTKFEKIENAAVGQPNYKASGNLTIKGKENPVEFNCLIEYTGGILKSTAKITIDRTKWGIVYKSKSILGSMADKFIYDDMSFDVDLVTLLH